MHFALSGILWLAVVGLVVAAIIALLRRPRYAAVAPPQTPMNALDILSARYARGEIDAATYQAMRTHILSAISAARGTRAAYSPDRASTSQS